MACVEARSEALKECGWVDEWVSSSEFEVVRMKGRLLCVILKQVVFYGIKNVRNCWVIWQ